MSNQILNKNQIMDIAIDYMISKKVPIIIDTCEVEFAEDRDDESRKTLEMYNFAFVSFVSKHADDELDPGIWMLYVNRETGEVYMPPVM